MSKLQELVRDMKMVTNDCVSTGHFSTPLQSPGQDSNIWKLGGDENHMHGFLGNDPWFSMDHCLQQEVQNETHGSVALMLSRNITPSLEIPAKTFISQQCL